MVAAGTAGAFTNRAGGSNDMDGTTITTTSGTMHVSPQLPKTMTPHLLRQFIEGGISRDVLDKLPRFLVAQLEQIAARMRRQAFRAHKREHHAANHRAAALAGGGAREVARRTRQIAAGSLQAS